jgi:hypothetical protein
MTRINGQKRSMNSFIGEHAFWRSSRFPEIDPCFVRFEMAENLNLTPDRSTHLTTPRSLSAPLIVVSWYLKLSRKPHVCGLKDAILRLDACSGTHVVKKRNAMSVGRWRFSDWRHRITIGSMYRWMG